MQTTARRPIGTRPRWTPTTIDAWLPPKRHTVGMPFEINLHIHDHLTGQDGDSLPGFPIWVEGERGDFELTTDQKAEALAAVLWFLDKVSGKLTLTAAGYLKPVDVEALSQVLPEVARWYGKRNREDTTRPVADFRQAMKDFGLIRKVKGQLVLTPAGRFFCDDPEGLWVFLGKKITPGSGTFEHDFVMLALINTLAGHRWQHAVVCDQLTAMGWRHESGLPVQPSDLWPHERQIRVIIDNMIPADVSWMHFDDTPMPIQARAFAFQALTSDRQGVRTSYESHPGAG